MLIISNRKAIHCDKREVTLNSENVVSSLYVIIVSIYICGIMLMYIMIMCINMCVLMPREVKCVTKYCRSHAKNANLLLHFYPASKSRL